MRPRAHVSLIAELFFALLPYGNSSSSIEISPFFSA